jgi:hypothetical protein
VAHPNMELPIGCIMTEVLSVPRQKYSSVWSRVKSPSLPAYFFSSNIILGKCNNANKAFDIIA